jgi:hypothetical protein
VNEQTRGPSRNSVARDGLAALAVVVIAAVLIFMVISHFVS